MKNCFKYVLCFVCVCSVLLTASGCGKVEYIDSVYTSEIVVDVDDDVSEGDVTGKEHSSDKDSSQKTSDGKKISNKNEDSKSTVKVDKNLNGTTVNILIWYDLDKREKSVLDAFTKKTGIKVKTKTVAEKNYLTTLSSKVASGASPDLACIKGGDYPTPIVRGLMQELKSEYFDINNKIYDKDLMDTYKWNGKYYGVAVKNSMMGDMYCVYYNKTMFEERGQKTPYEIWKKNPKDWNWSKFSEVCKNMTYNTSAGKVYGVSIAYPQATMLAVNSDFIKLTSKGLVNNMSDQKLITAWKWINGLKSDGYLMTENAYYTDLIQGKVAMHINGQWFMQKEQPISTNMKDKWGVVPFPKEDSTEYYVPFRAELWGVPKNAKNYAGAAACVNYWLDPANEEAQIYANDECREVHNWMWSQKKGILLSQGIVDFQKSGQSTEIFNKLMAGANAVDTVLASYSPAINSSIAYATDSLN